MFPDPGRTSVDRNNGEETFLFFGRQKRTITQRTVAPFAASDLQGLSI
jgi:hypothetical protein